MATSEPEPSSDHRIESLPLVDLRLLSQPELYTLSLSGATHRHRRNSDDDSVIPKIDRSNFNESAGSRKQTYSKLRLNKRKQNPAVPASSSFHIPLHISEPEEEENSRIIALLHQLFGVEPLRNNAPRNNDAPERRLVPVQVEFKQLPPMSAALFQNVPIDVVPDGSQRKRKRGRPRKDESSLTVFVEEPTKVTKEENSLTVFVEEPKKVTNEEKSVTVFVEKPKKVNGNGEGNAAVATATVNESVGLDEDLFEVELKRRTHGLETESQVMEFLETLNGEWASQRKKRRIVPATELGDMLPAGWKIVIIVMRRAGRASAVCRRYVSPDGHQFESCKEASAYLLSVSGVQDRSHLKSSYTVGAQQLSSSMNRASESSVGHVPTGDMKTYANASYLSSAGAPIDSSHEKQPLVSSSIGSENSNSDLALGCKLGDATGGAFRDFDHQTEDKQLSKADKNDGNSVQECSLVEDRVCNVQCEKLVGVVESSDAACNLYIPLVFSTPFSNNRDNGQISDEINSSTCMKGGISNFASHDRNTGCHETVTCGNERAHVDNNGLGLSVKLVEENIQKPSFESSMLAPNSEGKILAGKNLEDTNLISSLEDREIRDGNAVKDDKQQIICSRDQTEIKDVSTDVKLQSSSEGCSLVSSHNELNTSINNMDRTQTSELKDSAEENIFDSDLFSSSIDERTHVRSGYISNVSFSSCTHASEYGGFDFASDLKLAKDVSDNHILSNEEAVTRCLQERSSLNDQNSSMMDNMLHRSSESNLFALTGNQHSCAFHDNVNISDGTFDVFKAVDAGCMEPQLGIVSCSNIAVDAYTTASIMQGKPQGCVSVPLGGNILNFEKTSDDGVNKANKSCLPETAQNEVEIFQTESMGLPKFR